MTRREFIKKYKGRTFIIEHIKDKDVYSYLVFDSDYKVLDTQQEEIFWDFYPDMYTIKDDGQFETVKWIE